MRAIDKESIRMYSCSFHGVFSAVVVPCLVVFVLSELSLNLIVLWAASIAAACFWGWRFGSWYIPMGGEKIFFEPFLVTPIVSFLSALCSGLFYIFVVELTTSFSPFNFGSVLGGGLLLGVYAFILTLPVTSLCGVLIALYLFKFGGYKHVENL